MPSGDLLICAGDVTNKGELGILQDFNKWLGTLDFKYKVMIAGNHDFCFEGVGRNIAESLLTNVTYLFDSEVEIEGLKIYGSPWTPYFHNWAFNLRRGPAIEKFWNKIPKTTDILITHGPPFGILDWVDRPSEEEDPIPGVSKVGCQDLTKALKRLTNLKLHVFGHIHEAGGMVTEGGTVYVNASQILHKDKKAGVHFKPYVVNL